MGHLVDKFKLWLIYMTTAPEEDCSRLEQGGQEGWMSLRESAESTST